MIDSTTPGRSALTVTPRTACTVPIAARLAGHGSCRALIVVTASGGGRKEDACAIAAWICRVLTAPRMPTTPTTAISISQVRLLIETSLRFAAYGGVSAGRVPDGPPARGPSRPRGNTHGRLRESR